MARKQTLVQLTEGLVAALDREAAERRITRSALIRDAIEDYLERESVEAQERRLVEGYTRHPQEDFDTDWILKEWLAEESW